MNSLYNLTDVTLLITHYNRSGALENLLQKFGALGVSFGDIVVSDDCSNHDHLHHVLKMQQRFGFRLVQSQRNKGLGNNANKGQAAVNTSLTLYVQDDFEPTADFVSNFESAISLMSEDKWDLIRFYFFPWDPFPYLKKYKHGFAEMLFRKQLWYMNHMKYRIYSDHPHLRKSDFNQKFGLFDESKHSDQAEYDMCLNFIAKGGKALMLNSAEAFKQGSTREVSTMQRSSWRLRNNLPIKMLRFLYLKYKVVRTGIKLMQGTVA